MRILITLTFLLLCYSNSFGQPDTSKTEIIIIGTIHQGNKYFNHKELYKVLKTLNPDVILDENSKKHKHVFGLKTAAFLKIANPSIETLALQKISKRKKNTIILPYDTVFARRQYIKKNIDLKTAVYNSLEIVTKEYSDSLNYTNYLTKRNRYFNLIQTQNLEEINEPKIYNIARELSNDEEEHVLPLTKKYLKDTILIKDFEDDLDFWNSRNNFMVRQIEKYAKVYSRKKIIVLTGLNHKYFLTDKLANNKYNNIKLTEISNK